MDPQWKTYHSRMQHLERNLADHDSRFNKFDHRNETHSAKLRTLETQLEDLKLDNSRLYNEVVSLRSHENPGQKNVDQRLNQQPPDSYRSGQHTERYHDERGRPEYRQDDHDRRGEPQKRRDLDRIEMHEGNFKPYASNYYQDKLNTRNPVRKFLVNALKW